MPGVASASRRFGVRRPSRVTAETTGPLMVMAISAAAITSACAWSDSSPRLTPSAATTKENSPIWPSAAATTSDDRAGWRRSRSSP